MVDLDAIRASRAACADLPWSCPCVSGEQLDALVAELERLRSERSLLEQEALVYGSPRSMSLSRWVCWNVR